MGPCPARHSMAYAGPTVGTQTDTLSNIKFISSYEVAPIAILAYMWLNSTVRASLKNQGPHWGSF